MLNKLLVFLKLLSPCCHARMEYEFGWDYRYDGYRCLECYKLID